jgi:hypothetical protein
MHGSEIPGFQLGEIIPHQGEPAAGEAKSLK